MLLITRAKNANAVSEQSSHMSRCPSASSSHFAQRAMSVPRVDLSRNSASARNRQVVEIFLARGPSDTDDVSAGGRVHGRRRGHIAFLARKYKVCHCFQIHL